MQSNPNIITLTIDGHKVSVDKGTTIMEAAKKIGIKIPHFCYHPRLSIAGNCRMCLVEVEGGPPKPQASCALPVSEGMVVKTESEMVVKARKDVMELMLVNHPLDCPVCDKGGECELQNIAMAFGSDKSEFNEDKLISKDKYIGAKIKTNMTRCIKCMRCVRFATEVAGVEEFGATGRGETTDVGTYISKTLSSELAGNMIDLCPVGALNSKPYTFTARPWELSRTKTIDVTDPLCSHIEVHSRGGEVMRVIPRDCEDINEEWIPDSARFSYDGIINNRLSSPLLRKGKKQVVSSWDKVFSSVARNVKKSSKVAAVAGDVKSVEDLYSFKSFMQEVLGVVDIDARPFSFNLPLNLDRSNYIFNSTVKGVDEADAVLLIGVNPRKTSPVLNARIGKAVRCRNVPVALIGEKAFLTYNYDHLGTGAEDVSGLLSSRSRFVNKFKKAKKPMIIVGEELLCRSDAISIMKNIEKFAEKTNLFQGDKWNGLNVLVNSVTTVTALDLKVQPSDGRSKKEIANALLDGKIDVLFVYGNVGISIECLSKAKFLVYIGTHENEISKIANVVLPTLCYVEKNSFWVNLEGRVQEGLAAVPAFEEAKEDWKVFRALSSKFSKPLAFNSQQELREKIMKEYPFYEHVNNVKTLPYKNIEGTMKKLLKAPFVCENYVFTNNDIVRNSNVMHKVIEEME